MTTLERALIGLLTVIGLGLLSFWAGQDYGQTQERKAWESRINEERAKAAADARQAERDQQAGVNDALERKNRTLAGINARLAADLERLRQRPERPSGVPEAPVLAARVPTGLNWEESMRAFLQGSRPWLPGTTANSGAATSPTTQ